MQSEACPQCGAAFSRAGWGISFYECDSCHRDGEYHHSEKCYAARIASLEAEVASYERGEKLLAARIDTVTEEVTTTKRFIAEKLEDIEIYKAMTNCFEEIRARDAILIGNDFS